MSFVEVVICPTIGIGTAGYIPFRNNESLTVTSDYAVQTSNMNIK